MIGTIRRQLADGHVWLRFEPGLEQAYRRASNAAAQTNRVALLAIAVFVLLLNPILDQTYFGVPAAVAGWSQLMMLGGILPTLLLSIVWCVLRPQSRATEGVIVAQYVIVSLGLLANHVILSRYGTAFPIEFMGIAAVAVIALGRVRTWLILPVAAVLAVLTLMVETWLVDTTSSEYYSLSAAGALALFAVYIQYSSEHMLRRSWLEHTLLQLVARHDGLTGLLNRHALESALAMAQAHAARERHGFGLVMIDIDEFGAYNNYYGHPAGDAALRAVSEVIEAHARRPLDVCGRYGGEEFVALWIDARPAELEAHAERLRAAIEALAIAHGASRVAPVVTVSIGLCHVIEPLPDDSLAGVLAHADELLFKAKAAGRNRVKSAEFSRPDASQSAA